MQFSTDRQYLPLLAALQVTAASPANNHSTDFGAEGYTQTSEALADAGVTSFGHPTRAAPVSVTYVTLDDSHVAVVGLHTLFTAVSLEELEDVFAQATRQSDMQVAYVHWGEEYILTHNTAQAVLSASLRWRGLI